MKAINFVINEVDNVVENTKVSAAFVQELKEAFLMFPVRTDMRFKQSSKGELIISVTVVYATGMTQHFEGAGDADLISAIHFGMAKIINGLHDYKIYQRFIFSYSKPFANFAAISEVLMRYDTERTYLTKGVIEIIFLD